MRKRNKQELDIIDFIIKPVINELSQQIQGTIYCEFSNIGLTFHINNRYGIHFTCDIPIYELMLNNVPHQTITETIIKRYKKANFIELFKNNY